MIKRDIRIKGLTKAIVALFSWGSICTAAHSSLQTDIERALTEEGLTGIAWSMVNKRVDVEYWKH
jgi:hypothetical protein